MLSAGKIASVTEAAITLLRAIQAKFVMYRMSATTCAPGRPRGARSAMIDGTPHREPTGTSRATRTAPITLPAITAVIEAARDRPAFTVAPAMKVVATTLAPAKIRKRSSEDCVRRSAGMGSRSAAFMKGVAIRRRREDGRGPMASVLRGVP